MEAGVRNPTYSPPANARRKKDNTDIIRNTSGTLLNTELKQIRE
jgi:hypothetical protein